MLKRLTLTLLCTIAIVPAAKAQDQTIAAPKPLLNIQTITSPKHGITAWLVEDHTNPILSLRLAFKGAGSKQDSADKQGLSRLLSNTMDEGAGDLTSTQFQKALNEDSITLHFGSSRDDLTATLTTLTATQDKALELLKLALTAPRFDDEPLQRMIAANQSRIKSDMARPQWMAARIMNDAAYQSHPYALNSGGTLSSLPAITAQDLRDYHTKAIAKDNLLIAVSGAITPQDLATTLDETFANLPQNNQLPKHDKVSQTSAGQTLLYKHEIPQTIITIKQPSLTVSDPDYINSQIVNFILGGSGFGSRLTSTIREDKGLTYGIHTSLNNYDLFNSLDLTTSTKNESAAEMLLLIADEYSAITSGDKPITLDELEAAKTYLTGQLALSLTSNSNIAALLISLQTQGLPIDYLEKRDLALRQASLNDIQATAQKLLDKQEKTTVLVGSPKDIKPDTIIKILPNVE